jgi:hypothetical protein
MKIKKLLIAFFLYSIIQTFIYSDEILKEPSWVYLKKAENLCQNGSYSEAVIEARNARKKFINEQLDKYFTDIYYVNKDKTEYEIKKMVDKRREELYLDDNYPSFHELIGDLYVKTNFIDEAIKEYRNALSQKKYFEYPQKNIELKYKIAHVYHKKNEYELEDVFYREIVKDYLDSKSNEYWNRLKNKINNEPSLNNIFRIYKLNGIEFLEALYKIGRRSSILQRDKEALFYLTNAAVIWMTYYSTIIRKYYDDFKYSNPVDFLNFLSKNRIEEYSTNDFFIDEIFFYIGYTFLIVKKNDLKDYYFNLALSFSKDTKDYEDLKDRINYFKIDKNYFLKLEELQ